MDIKTRVALRIKAIRKRRGFSQEELAELIDRSPDAISNLERGISVPALDTLELLAAGLKVPISELLGEAGTESEKRVGAMTRLVDAARGLDDRMLAAAAEIVEVLARTTPTP
jgi:transcriptional regulator with XRE-family HTH domain